MNQAIVVGDRKLLMTKRRRSRGRRGVRVMTWMAALFLAFNILGGALVDRYWPHVRFPSAHERLSRLDRRVQNGHSPDFLVFGSSRFNSYVHETVLEDSFRKETGIDAGIHCCFVPAGDLISTRALLSESVRRGTKPRFAVIEIAPESLNRYNGWLHYHASRQLGWAEFFHLVPDIFRTHHTGRYLEVLLTPLLVYRERMITAAQQWALACAGVTTAGRQEEQGITVRPMTPPNFATGSTPTTSPDAERVAAAEREHSIAGQKDVRRWLRNYDVGGYPCWSLEEILAECEREGIVPILIGTPVTTFHRECYTPAVEEKFLAHLHKLTQAGRCQFHDLRAALPDALFCDIHHGKPPAEVVFSEILVREVLAPMYRSVRPVEGVPVSRPKAD